MHDNVFEIETFKNLKRNNDFATIAKRAKPLLHKYSYEALRRSADISNTIEDYYQMFLITLWDAFMAYDDRYYPMPFIKMSLNNRLKNIIKKSVAKKKRDSEVFETYQLLATRMSKDISDNIINIESVKTIIQIVGEKNKKFVIDKINGVNNIKDNGYVNFRRILRTKQYAIKGAILGTGGVV